MPVDDRSLLSPDYPSSYGYGSVNGGSAASFFEPPFTLTRTRWYMLAVFFSACFMQGLTWTPLSAVPDAAKGFFPCLDNSLIYWSLNIGCMIYMPVSCLSPRILASSRGMQRSVRLGCFFSLISACVRLPCAFGDAEFRSGRWCIVLLELGGLFCGIAGPFTQGSHTKLAMLWFPPEERQKAQAVGFLGTYLGAGASYLLSPAIVQAPGDIPRLLKIEAAMAVVPAFLAFVYYPETPPRSAAADDSSIYHEAMSTERSLPLETSGRGAVTFWGKVSALSSSRSFMLLLLSAGLLHGVFATWGASMALSLAPVGVPNARADLLAFSATMLYVAGTQVLTLMRVFFPSLCRRFRRKWLSSKQLLLLLLLLTAGSFFLFCLTIPTLGWFSVPALQHAVVRMAITAVHGLVAGATAPVFMELSAEVTHPVSEDVPASLMGLFINICHVSAFIFFTYVRTLSGLCTFVLATYCVCLLVFLPVGTSRSPAHLARLAR